MLYFVHFFNFVLFISSKEGDAWENCLYTKGKLYARVCTRLHHFGAKIETLPTVGGGGGGGTPLPQPPPARSLRSLAKSLGILKFKCWEVCLSVIIYIFITTGCKFIFQLIYIILSQIWKPSSELAVAQVEVHKIADYLHADPWLGSQVTKQAILTQLPRATVIHLALYGSWEEGVLAVHPQPNHPAQREWGVSGGGVSDRDTRRGGNETLQSASGAELLLWQ